MVRWKKNAVSINILSCKHLRLALGDLNRKRNIFEDYTVASKLAEKTAKPSSDNRQQKKEKLISRHSHK